MLFDRASGRRRLLGRRRLFVRFLVAGLDDELLVGIGVGPEPSHRGPTDRDSPDDHGEERDASAPAGAAGVVVRRFGVRHVGRVRLGRVGHVDSRGVGIDPFVIVGGPAEGRADVGAVEVQFEHRNFASHTGRDAWRGLIRTVTCDSNGIRDVGGDYRERPKPESVLTPGKRQYCFIVCPVVRISMATTTSRGRRLPTSQQLFGAIVVLIGVLLLLDTTGVVETAELVVYVPSLFVLVGVWALVQSRLRNLVGPVVLIGVAAAWQLVALDYATTDEVVAFWPVLLIAFGASVILGQYRSRVTATEDSHTSSFAAFGGVERRNTSKSFTGADLTAAFGGSELDLRDAEVANRPARINAVALFGGVDIVVPREWNVRMEVLPILGAATDERARTENVNDEVDLVVTGFVAFGGISVSD